MLEALVPLACVRIDPRDDEDRVPLFDTPADERVLGLEIEDVEFVDPWRNDQQRRFTYVLCHRRVLDELDHLVLENDLARRRRNIFAEPERIHIRHGNAEATLSALQIIEQIRQPAQQVLAAGLNRLRQYFRICRSKIRRRQCIDELLRIEFDLPGCLFIKPLDAADGREDGASGKKITVADIAKYGVFDPFGVFEAFVRCAGRRWFTAE